MLEKPWENPRTTLGKCWKMVDFPGDFIGKWAKMLVLFGGKEVDSWKMRMNYGIINYRFYTILKLLFIMWLNETCPVRDLNLPGTSL